MQRSTRTGAAGRAVSRRRNHRNGPLQARKPNPRRSAERPAHEQTLSASRTQAGQAAAEIAALGEKIARGTKLFSEVRDEDVSIATTPKDEVWRQDKVTLYHYRPLAEPRVRIPVLIVYGLIGRYTMADLQEDRSLVRNLLNLGVDLYVVDWGNPSRADRWVTIDDYVDGYLAECVARSSRSDTVRSKISLLGICEGGVFTTCYAALYPETSDAMVLTITPIDFHADTVENRHGHGFINIWTRSLAPDDIDRLIEAHGTSAGRVHGLGVLDDDADAHHDQVQPRSAGHRGRSRQNF